jgi:hypothetical protein
MRKFAIQMLPFQYSGLPSDFIADLISSCVRATNDGDWIPSLPGTICSIYLMVVYANNMPAPVPGVAENPIEWEELEEECTSP